MSIYLVMKLHIFDTLFKLLFSFETNSELFVVYAGYASILLLSQHNGKFQRSYVSME